VKGLRLAGLALGHFLYFSHLDSYGNYSVGRLLSRVVGGTGGKTTKLKTKNKHKMQIAVVIKFMKFPMAV